MMFKLDECLANQALADAELLCDLSLDDRIRGL